MHRDDRSLFWDARLKGDVPEEYDIHKLEGKKCRVMIKHTKTDAGDVWENVTDVMKAAQRAFHEI
jgi:hypothetical protein